MIFQAQPWTVQEAWRRICHDHDKFAVFRDAQSLNHSGTHMEAMWEAPQVGKFKLNVDDNYRDDSVWGRCRVL